MSRRARIAFLVLVALQAAVPVAMAAVKEAHLAFDSTVRLRTEPIDPLDVFRGRYVRLRYEIGSLPVEGVASRGTTVYVPLHREGDVWTGSVAVTSPPPDGTYIRGRVRDDAAPGEAHAIEYGIETYFVDERKAREVERGAAGGGAFVDVALDDDGSAQLERLILP
jgi:uncharacterized membrane-anchored protein